MIFPIRNQRIKPDRIDDGAGKNVRADFRPLFKNHDRDVVSTFPGKLLQPNGSGKPCRTSADNNDIEFHGLPLGQCVFWLIHQAGSLCLSFWIERMHAWRQSFR